MKNAEPLRRKEGNHDRHYRCTFASGGEILL